MSKVDVAEWILSVTTNRQRAASTAGDLLQESLAEGSVWFWWSLARTTTSLVWREFTLYPLQMVRLGFVALVLTAISIPVIIVVGIIGALFVSFVLDVSSLTADSAVFLGTGFAIVGTATSQLFVGRWLSRRAPGRELAACTATILMIRIVLALIIVATALINRTPLNVVELLMELTLAPVDFLIQLAILLAGVAWARRSARPLVAS